MHISENRLLQKMEEALRQAQNSQGPSEAATHLANIKLLSELWLEAYKKQQGKTPHEIFPNQKEHVQQQVQHPPIASPSVPEKDSEDDGFSIFEF